MRKYFFKAVYNIGEIIEDIGRFLTQYATNTKEKERFIYGERIERKAG